MHFTHLFFLLSTRTLEVVGNNGIVTSDVGDVGASNLIQVKDDIGIAN